MKSIEYTEIAGHDNLNKFLNDRNKIILECNDAIRKVANKLIIKAKDERITLCRLPLKAVLFRTKEDREAKRNNTFINYGEYHVDELELYYVEFFVHNEARVAGNIGLIISGKQPDRTTGDFSYICGFEDFDYVDLSWGKNWFFLNKNDYFTFKEVVLNFKKELPSCVVQ